MGPSWEVLGASWEALGHQNGAPNRLREPSWHLFDLMAPSFDPKESPRERLGAVLGASWGVLGASWRLLGAQGRPKSENVDFRLFYNGLAAHLPWEKGQQVSEPDPWRG